MKIAFIQPRSFHCWEALNFGYMAAYLKQNGFNNIEFFSGFYDSDEEIIKGCEDADIVAFSCTSPQLKHALTLAEKVKTEYNHIVFGGVHPTVLPEETLAQASVDAVVVGEGERAILDIVRGDRGRVIKKPFIDDLDSLPFPDRKIIKQERNIMTAYRDNGYRIASVFSSRGCPFDCTFCASKALWSRKGRFRSADNILDEFEAVVKDLSIDFMKFSDDTFTIYKKLVIEFCEKKIRRGSKTPWGCNIRVDSVDDETLGLMVKANCREVWVGVESGSPKILKDMKKNISLDKVRRCFSRAAELGLFRRAYFMLGMPNEDHEDIKMTENIIDEIQADAVGFTILAPYPGSAYFDPVKHKNVDWSTVDEYRNSYTSTKYLTNAELHSEQKRLVNKYKDRIVFRQKQVN